MSYRPAVSFSRNSTITSEKLNGKNYLSCSASIELWLLGHSFHEHLEQNGSNVPSNKADSGREMIFSLVRYCGNMWSPIYWALLDRLKHSTPFGKRIKIFLQMIFTAFTTLQISFPLFNKQIMTLCPFISEAQSVV